MRDAVASPVVRCVAPVSAKLTRAPCARRRRSAHTCCAWLESHREEIETGKLKVFFQDECHLLWGDVCGYVWGQTNQRITVPMTNEKQKQTYYGAIDLQTHELLVQPYKKGESQFTIAFVKYLQAQYPQSRIALIWDGASYHRSQQRASPHVVKNYLNSINQGLEPRKWKITCIRFAPQRGRATSASHSPPQGQSPLVRRTDCAKRCGVRA